MPEEQERLSPQWNMNWQASIWNALLQSFPGGPRGSPLTFPHDLLHVASKQIAIHLAEPILDFWRPSPEMIQQILQTLICHADWTQEAPLSLVELEDILDREINERAPSKLIWVKRLSQRLHDGFNEVCISVPQLPEIAWRQNEVLNQAWSSSGNSLFAEIVERLEFCQSLPPLVWVPTVAVKGGGRIDQYRRAVIIEHWSGEEASDAILRACWLTLQMLVEPFDNHGDQLTERSRAYLMLPYVLTYAAEFRQEPHPSPNDVAQRMSVWCPELYGESDTMAFKICRWWNEVQHEEPFCF